MASWRRADWAKPPTKKKNCKSLRQRFSRRLVRCFTIPSRTGLNNFFIAWGSKQRYSFLRNWTPSMLLAGPRYSDINAVKERGSRSLVAPPSNARRPRFFISKSFIMSSHSPGYLVENASTTVVPKNCLRRDTNSSSTFVPPNGPPVTWNISFILPFVKISWAVTSKVPPLQEKEKENSVYYRPRISALFRRRLYQGLVSSAAQANIYLNASKRSEMYWRHLYCIYTAISRKVVG